MKSSWKTGSERQFFDVYTKASRGFWRGLSDRVFTRKTVNLRPNLVRRYPLFLAAVAAVFATGIYIGNRVLTRAEMADYYPVSCLGTWQNAGNAAGEPENFDPGSAADGFKSDNSAIYSLPGSDIFCGDFLPADAETKGDLKSVTLTMMWHVGSGKDAGAVEMKGSIPQSESPATPESESSTPSSSGSATVREFFAWNHLAYAQEVPAGTPPAEISSPETSAPAPSEVKASEPQRVEERPSSDTTEAPPPAPQAYSTPAEPPTVVLPPLQAELAPPEATSTPSSTSVSEPAALPEVAPPPPDENFLKVSYSLDGQSWTELGKINPSNWQNFTVHIPIQEWSELKKLQISVQGMPTVLDPVPKVYLAGMFVEAKYDLPPLFGDEPKVEPQAQETVPPVIDVSGRNKPKPADRQDAIWGAGDGPAFDLDLGNMDAPVSAPVNTAPTGSVSSSSINASDNSGQ